MGHGWQCNGWRVTIPGPGHPPGGRPPPEGGTLLHRPRRPMLPRCECEPCLSPHSPHSNTRRRFWFAGDTGYCTVFREIGERLGPFDLAAIPTAAYLPRDFMRAQHVNPAEAVRIHRDVRSRRSMAIHLATFPLTDEPMDEPVGELRRQAAAAGLGDEEFVSLRHGASIVTSGGVDLVAPVTLSC